MIRTFTELDDDAKSNLNEKDLREFHVYKQRLLNENENDFNMHDILTGFIWDCIESYSNEEFIND